MRICIYISISIYIYICIYVYRSVNVHVSVWVYMYVIDIYIYIYIYIRVYVYAYVLFVLEAGDTIRLVGRRARAHRREGARRRAEGLMIRVCVCQDCRCEDCRRYRDYWRIQNFVRANHQNPASVPGSGWRQRAKAPNEPRGARSRTGRESGNR